jgi:Fe(3+) dicitrate transport protein
MKYFTIILLSLFVFKVNAQNITINGRITALQIPIGNVTVTLKNTAFATATDSTGYYQLKNIPAGNYTMIVSAVGYKATEQTLKLSGNVRADIKLEPETKELKAVVVNGDKDKTFGITRLRAIDGVNINAGKKSEVIVMSDVTANTSTNNARQIYNKVAGLNIWESDGAGIQLGIGGRGLNPNRVTNFNTRQNGYDISADALGYPESYYTPSAEMVDRIEILRGAASLQYGTQFGGLINFKLKDGPTDKPFEFTSRETVGSWGFLNTANSVGGTSGKFTYYSFFEHKQGDGWRPNAGFNVNTEYTSVTWKPTTKFSLTFQYTYMDYLAQMPGGLTDAEFTADPRQSIRNRNWFKVNWNLGAILLNYDISSNLRFNSRFFFLDAGRDALGDLDYINRADPGGDRSLYIDKYINFGNESRLLYTYKIADQPQNLLLGVRYYHGYTNRQQGFGNTGSTGYDSDFAYTPTTQADANAYTHYTFPNYNLAFFAENIFRITPKLSIIPGARYENIITKADGNYTLYNTDMAGNVIFSQPMHDVKNSTRHFLIGGVGLSYFQNEAMQLYANISQNYRAINFNDLNSSIKGLRVNPNLQDETGYSADAGMRGNISGIFNYDVSLFMIHYNNRIGTIDTADANFNDFRYRTNIAASRNIGLESFAELELLHFFNPGLTDIRLSIFSNLALINARYISSKEPAFNNKKVELAPDVIFKSGLSYKRKKFSASYQFAYTSSQFTDATNATFTANAINGLVPAYTVMDFSAEYQLSKVFTLQGSVNNLANAKYFTRRADSYPGPGIIPADARSFFFTLQVRL